MDNRRDEPNLKLINMEQVEVEKIDWLLYPFIPFGKVTIVQGDPGEGKTTMVLQIIAKLTKGEAVLPSGSDEPALEAKTVDLEPVNVIYQTAEDGLGDTIKPRLLSAGADCSRVMVIDDNDQALTMMDARLEEIKAILKKYGQEHLLNHYDKLDDVHKQKLLEEIENIDFELVDSLYRSTEKKEKSTKDEITPIDYLDKYKLNEKYKYYENIGKKAIKEGKLAAVTMAGGQGTRLGHNGPKGTYDIGLNSHKSLFELLCDRLKEEGKKYGVTIPWFIMTSKENNKATVEFFEKHKYFGYEKDKNIFFFIQGELPMMDTEGKILIGEDGLIKLAADGHGGIYESLVKNGMTKKMREMGVEWVFIGGVDNCLVKMVDPVLMGVAIDKQVTVACKSVVKANPKEKVGVFCKRNGKPNVIEYTEITDEMAEATDENGELLYGESHILCNLFSVGAIERMGANPLPYHVAYKKAKYIDKKGDLVEPESPNAYKFEAFLFDAFGEVDEMAVLRVKREEEFAPVKNADSAGVDCPRTARELYKKFYNLD